MALVSLFGSGSVEKILLFLLVNGKGYPSQLARIFSSSLTPIQKACAKLEKGGIIVSEEVGKIRFFQFNPYYPLLSQLQELLKRAYTLLPPEEKKIYCYVGQLGEKKMRSQIESALLLWERLLKISRVHFKAISQQREENGLEGEGEGIVSLSKEGADTLIFQEEGEWISKADKRFNFSNTFRWQFNREKALISLEHLRLGKEHPVFLFHLVPTAKHTFSSLDSHLCQQDTYMGQVRLNRGDIAFFWRVIGPNKNEELLYHYT